MISIYIKKIRWLLCCLIFFMITCREKPLYHEAKASAADSLTEIKYIKSAYNKLSISKNNIKTGDLITRTGNDFTSQSLRTLNQRNKTYSHCGIASIENDSLFIYHSLGGEWNPDQKIRRDLYSSFANPYNNNGIGIFRFAATPVEINRLIKQVQDFYRKEIMFDMDFDLSTDDRMYCAEFIYKSFIYAFDNKINFPLSHIGEFKFIGVDDLFLHPTCFAVLEIKYK